MRPSLDDTSLPELAARVEDLAAAVERLAQRQAASDLRSWLTITDPDAAAVVLVDLAGWLDDVWARYSGPALPDCWWRHPWVIEELHAAKHAWDGCLRRGAPPTGLTEWHRTVRPGVQQRIAAALAMCEDGEHPLPNRTVSRPASPADVIEPWLTDRSEPCT